MYTAFRTMKYWIFCVAALFVAISAHGQNSNQLTGKSIPELRSEAQEAVLSLPSKPQAGLFQSVATSTPSYPVLKAFLTVGEVPKAWRYCDLGLFCKLDVQLEKAVKFPVKFRLGEAQEVERKEGKLSDGLKQQQP